MASSYFEMGIVRRVTIESQDGDSVVITNPEVTVTVEQETLDHMSMAGGEMHRERVVVNRKEKVEIKTSQDVGEELMRLIRED